MTYLVNASLPDSAEDPLDLVNGDTAGICALVVRKLWSCEQSATNFRICAALCTLAPMPPLMPTAYARARASSVQNAQQQSHALTHLPCLNVTW
jgi:hypothetical protein